MQVKRQNEECYNSIALLNENATSVLTKDTVDHLIKNRNALGSNHTLQLLTDAELQSHVNKLREIATLAAANPVRKRFLNQAANFVKFLT